MLFLQTCCIKVFKTIVLICVDCCISIRNFCIKGSIKTDEVAVSKVLTFKKHIKVFIKLFVNAKWSVVLSLISNKNLNRILTTIVQL